MTIEFPSFSSKIKFVDRKRSEVLSSRALAVSKLKKAEEIKWSIEQMNETVLNQKLKKRILTTNSNVVSNLSARINLLSEESNTTKISLTQLENLLQQGLYNEAEDFVDRLSCQSQESTERVKVTCLSQIFEKLILDRKYSTAMVFLDKMTSVESSKEIVSALLIKASTLPNLAQIEAQIRGLKDPLEKSRALSALFKLYIQKELFIHAQFLLEIIEDHNVRDLAKFFLFQSFAARYLCCVSETVAYSIKSLELRHEALGVVFNLYWNKCRIKDCERVFHNMKDGTEIKRICQWQMNQMSVNLNESIPRGCVLR